MIVEASRYKTIETMIKLRAESSKIVFSSLLTLNRALPREEKEQ